MVTTPEPFRGLGNSRGAIPKGLIAAVGIIGAGLGMAVGGLWLGRSLEQKALTGPHKVQPTSNPNHHYLVEMRAVHLGASGGNFIIRAETRLMNSGVVPLNLDATTVRLVDANNHSYAPTFPPQTRTGISLASQQSEAIPFEFLDIPSDALKGELFLQFHQRLIRIKSGAPLQTRLRDGEFRVLQRIRW
jgi:hypothetical protein